MYPAETRRTREMTRSRILALMAVCTMSIGSHFGTYLLGPLKSRLHEEMGTSNSQFSLLIASFNLNSTWTPLVGGLFVARFGTAWSSIATTGCVLLGQLILLLGVLTSHIHTMTIGLFIFGLGLTPLAVVQETLVSHLAPSNHLGISLALGLVSGKSSSYISSVVSLPLAKQYGDRVPFGLAVGLCGLSFTMNMLRLMFGWGREKGENGQEDQREVKVKKLVKWGGVGQLGDVFWLYIFLNVLSGAIWQPFLHLSANLIQLRYNVSASLAATQASVLLAGAIILYPIIGYLTDRLSPGTPRMTFRLIHLSSVLTLLAYTYLALPPSLTHSPWLGMILFALGHGMATLLMVVLVPRLLPPALVPLGLGLHKSMEMASSTLSQTVSGLWLDAEQQDDAGEGEGLLRAFWIINSLQLVCAIGLWLFEASRARMSRGDGLSGAGGQVQRAEEYEVLPMNDLPDLDGESDDDDEERSQPLAVKYEQPGMGSVSGIGMLGESERRADGMGQETSTALARTDGERRRGRVALAATLGFIVLVWVVFLGSAWSRL